jgi:hypothetical protein
MKKQITVASLVMGVGALVVLIFSFLTFYESSATSEISSNAWGGDIGLAPMTFLPVLLAIVLLVLVILDLTGVKLPEKVLTFTWPQIYVFLGISTAGMMLGWLFTSPEGLDKGAGLILMLLGSLAMAAGAIMAILGVGTNTVGIPTGGSSASSASSTSTAPAAPPPGGGYSPSAPGPPPSAPPPPPPSGGTPPPPPPPPA